MFLFGSDTHKPEGYPAYQNYLIQNKSKFPPAVFEWVTSDWYYNFNDHRCPHDSWLETLSFREYASGERSECRGLDIELKLLGAYHDLYLIFIYKNVSSYSLTANALENAHGDWILDEYRISETGLLIHEIEWARLTPNGRWLIECEDISFRTEII